MKNNNTNFNFILYNRICGPRGIPAAATEFRNLRLQGKGHEKSDLDTLLSKMEHWAHRLFPKLSFDDCVEQVAKLGNNRTVQVSIVLCFLRNI